VVLIILGSCATEKMAYISKDYDVYGTWVNPDAKPEMQGEKVVIHTNGKMEWYPIITSTSFVPVEFVITNKWIDSTGYVWYTLIRDAGELAGQDYGLCKISDSGKVLEMSFNRADYPNEIDPIHTEYIILYRQ
jgi:hypothetical protein